LVFEVSSGQKLSAWKGLKHWTASVVAILVAAFLSVATAQANCEAIPHGPEHTDCYLGLSQLYRRQSDLAAARARAQSDAAWYRATTRTDPSKRKPHRDHKAQSAPARTAGPLKVPRQGGGAEAGSNLPEAAPGQGKPSADTANIRRYPMCRPDDLSHRRDRPQLCGDSPFDRLLGCDHRCGSGLLVARYDYAFHVRGPLPDAALDTLNHRKFNASISHYQPRSTIAFRRA
jgi:hypothetical protein